jgi:hypothetical protein
MTPTNDLPTQLREYNRWRRGDETLEQPHPKDIGAMIDKAADRLEELQAKLAAERALADRLAQELKAASGYINFETEYFEDESALAAWKEARNDT